MEFLRQVNEEWSNHVNNLIKNKQYVRRQEAETFKKSILEKVDALSKELTSDEVKSIFNYGINQEEDNSFWLNIKMIFPLIYISYLVLLIFTIIYLSIKD
jgi:hypothetical protein